MANRNTIRDAALKLPLKERARLAHELLISLDGGAEEDVERDWIVEAERRWVEISAGRTELHDAEGVLREAKAITDGTAGTAKRKRPTRRR